VRSNSVDAGVIPGHTCGTRGFTVASCVTGIGKSVLSMLAIANVVNLIPKVGSGDL